MNVQETETTDNNETETTDNNETETTDNNETETTDNNETETTDNNETEKVNREEIVKEYLIKRSYRMLKKIQLGGDINMKLYVLSVASIGVLPLIQKQENFVVKTAFPFFNSEYELLMTLYIIHLWGLLTFNICLGGVNIFRKWKYKKLRKEILKLEGVH